LVTGCKLQVAQGFGSVLAVRFTDQAQKLNCVADAAIHVHVLKRHVLVLSTHPIARGGHNWPLLGFGWLFNHQRNISERVSPV